MRNSWVKLSRKDVMNNPRWPGNTGRRFSTFEAELYLYALEARGVDNGKLKKDQAAITERSLAELFKWDQKTVHHFLKQLETEGRIWFESRARNRHESSIITVFRPPECSSLDDSLESSLESSVKVLKQRGLSLVPDSAESSLESSLKSSFLKKDREGKRNITSKPVGENAKREAAKRVLEYCQENGHWRPFQSEKTKENATKRIIAWLGKGGYTEEQLIGYVDTYIKKRKAHLSYVKENGSDQGLYSSDPRWCPHIKWSISELFRPGGKYFEKWIDQAEKTLTREERSRVRTEQLRAQLAQGV